MKLKTALLLLAISVCALNAHAADETAPTFPSVGAVGDLLVAPTRIVLDARHRSAEIALVNTGDHTTKYVIRFDHLTMEDSGKLVPVNEGTFADSYVLFAPHIVTLEPHITQSVRLRLRLPEGLPDGEYRTHLRFGGVQMNDEPVPAAKDGELGIRITTTYDVSIPLLVRQGDTSADTTIANLRLEDGLAAFDLDRTGSRSTYGNVVVYWRQPGKEEVVVGAMNGVSIYQPLGTRKMKVPLQTEEKQALSGGVLRVTYVDAEKPKAEAVVAAELALP